MNKLATYVGAIHGRPVAVTITEQSVATERWLDQGFEVVQEETVYRFSNGVVIRRQIEQDQFPSELTCAECWISYEVMEQPPALAIQPAHKSFDNACREAYWLNYHLA